MKKENKQIFEILAEEPVEQAVDPTCQVILSSSLSASEKVTRLVDIYRQSHPEFTTIVPVPDDLMHPAYLAVHRPIKSWMYAQCNDCCLTLWTLMLKAAKEWFPDKAATLLGHSFCVSFEMESATFWNGHVDFMPLMSDYMRWRYGKSSQH